MIARLIGGGVALALAGLLLWLFGQARYDAGQMAERARWERVAAKTAQDSAKASIALARRSSEAIEAHAREVVRLQPIIQRSKETLRVFHQTPDGARLCLAPDRVRGIEADRAALFADAAGSADGSDGAVPPDPFAGRIY